MISEMSKLTQKLPKVGSDIIEPGVAAHLENAEEQESCIKAVKH